MKLQGIIIDTAARNTCLACIGALDTNNRRGDTICASFDLRKSVLKDQATQDTIQSHPGM
jgi:hypothetical protein